jgi:molybdopterin-guanine dinucleotide biosynthesis protein B
LLTIAATQARTFIEEINFMRRLHVIGRKNSGKTTLVSELTRKLTEQGHRIGTIKHTHHKHELDTPGKDSHSHRTSGAACVGILSPQLNACFWNEPSEEADDRYAAFGPMFARCDLVMVEGDTQTRADKIEVWRASQQESPLVATDAKVLALVTDDTRPVTCRQFPRHPVDQLINWITRRYLGS